MPPKKLTKKQTKSDVEETPVIIDDDEESEKVIFTFNKLNKSVLKTANDYEHLTDIEHILRRPDMTIGSVTEEERNLLVYNFNTKILEERLCKMPQGLVHVYVEIVANASDNIINSREHKIDPGSIEVKMDNKVISVKNYGIPIPLSMKEDNKGIMRYIPELIFGMTKSGSNYKEGRHGIGMNGIGAKATNIYSVKFKVEIYNSVEKKHYVQIWENNMMKCNPPEITDYNLDISSVEITYEIDFKRFGYSEYPEEAKSIFAKILMDISLNNKCDVKFNSEVFNCSNLLKYTKLIFPFEIKNYLIHYQWPSSVNEDDIIKKQNGMQICKDPTILPIVEMCVVDAPNCGFSYSFVNCLPTPDGGCHINSATHAVVIDILDKINNGTSNKRGKNVKEPKKRTHKLNITDVKPHVFILLCLRCTDPHFDSQTKTKLKSPDIKIVIPEKLLLKVEKWKIVDMLHNAMESKELNNLKKTDGKASKNVDLEKGMDALNAGNYKNDENLNCTLIICEGDSASCYVEAIIPYFEGGSKYFGYIPVKGKSLNVMNASRFQLENNAELILIKKVFGLREGVDYSIEENYKTLRYGKVLVMSDADVDGIHITGLLLNIFFCRFKELLKRDFFYSYLIPIIKINVKGETIRFYTEKQYEKFTVEHPGIKNIKPEYFKGLSSAGDDDIIDDLTYSKNIQFNYDDLTEISMNLAFNKNLSNKRKNWILEFQQELDFIMEKKISVSEFIDNRLVLYALSNIKRSIPSLMDGLKDGQRKLLEGCFKLFGKKNESNKVFEICAYASKEMNYHHGGTSLEDTFFGMTWDFPGSNNIPYFSKKKGQFGSYFTCGKNHPAGRYPSSCLNDIIRYVYRDEDRPLLEYQLDDGKQIEPKEFYGVIPMILCNGCDGIGTGWSSKIPLFNPIDICEYLIQKNLDNEELPDINPWCHKFDGSLSIQIDNKKKKVSEGDDDDEDDDNAYDENKFCVVSEGRMTINGNKIKVSTLPIWKSGEKFHAQLYAMKQEKLITDFRYDLLKGDGKYEFFITSKPKNKLTFTSLGLKKKISMRNMWLLDRNNKPIKYNSQYEIIDSFYDLRLEIYQKRKDQIIKKIEDKIKDLNYRYLFIKYYKERKLIIEDREVSEINLKLDELEIPREYLNKIKIKELSKTDLNDYLENMKKHELELESAKNLNIKIMWNDDLHELKKKLISYYK
jgi:DNA topoisomerase-2